jgi:hypothetical protein
MASAVSSSGIACFPPPAHTLTDPAKSKRRSAKSDVLYLNLMDKRTASNRPVPVKNMQKYMELCLFIGIY